MEVTTFDYNLKMGFEYHHKGQLTTAKFITLRAPTSRNSDECGALKQAFYRSVPKDVDPDDKAKAKAEDRVIEGSDIVMALAASSEVEFSDVLRTAKKLFTSGVAMVEGETKMTMPMLDEMSQDDLEGMLGEYLVNFTLASSLK